MVIVFCYVEGIRPLVECIIHCVFWFAVEGKIIGTDKTAQRWSGGIGRYLIR